MNRTENRFSGKFLLLAVVLCGACAQSEVTIPEDAREKLAAARRMAQISEASREVIEEKLASLEAAESASPKKIIQYRDYLKRVQEFERTQRKLLKEMESLYEPFAPDEDAVSTSTNRNHELFAVSIPRDDASDRLDREFKRSLESFDEELLNKLDELAEEMEELEDDAAGESSELAAAIEAAQQRLEQNEADSREKKGDGKESQSAEGSGSGSDGGPDQAQPADPSTTGGGEMASETAGEGQEEELPGNHSSTGDLDEGGLHEGGEMDTSASGKAEERSAPGAGGTGRAEDTEGAPPDEPAMDSRDDDIISRQIREAAERETDPELKKKLWAEYRRYKESSTR
jgi:hypothetical protein